MKIFIISIAGMALLAAFPAAAYDLPKDIPARKPGLWEMRMTGTIGPNQLKAIKRYCLDENADRALHELTIRRKELDVVYSDISCQPPKISVTGNVVTGEMACRSNSTTDSETAGQDFRWTMTFESDSEVVNEEHSVARDVLFPGENSTVELQRWIGECPAGQKPGDGLDLGFNYNSEAWPAESRPISIQESSKVVEKMLNEAFGFNERLGPM